MNKSEKSDDIFKESLEIKVDGSISSKPLFVNIQDSANFPLTLRAANDASGIEYINIGDLVAMGSLRKDELLPDRKLTIGESGIMGNHISPIFVAPESQNRYEERIKQAKDAKEKIVRENKELNSKISGLANEINALKEGNVEKDVKIKELNDTLAMFNRNETIRHLIDRVHPDAVKLLGELPKLRGAFNNKTTHADVLAIDIRRSTDLMLKAKTPELFSKFITELCIQLSEIIKKHWGVFDKFTGDGILSFFPDLYSGKDSILKALAAAKECHEFFQNHYRASRGCFSTVLKDIGLGIGIDSGLTHMVSIGGGITVVGNPVVYACRLSSGAGPNETLLNQHSYEGAYPKFSEHYNFTETEIDIKHEGKIIAYSVTNNSHVPDTVKPTFEEYKEQPNQ